MSSRRGGRGGGRNPKDMPREQQVSRKVSWLLRHGADAEGLKLGKGGYVNVADAVSLISFALLSFSILKGWKVGKLEGWGFDDVEFFFLMVFWICSG